MRKIFFLIAWLIPAIGGYAQGLDASWHKIAGGGGNSSNASLTISGTIGQYDAQVASNNSLTISGGFWAGNGPTITLSPTALPAAGAGDPYSQAIIANGGTAPYIYTATVLPTGLSLSTDGILSGALTNRGSVNFSITAVDANGWVQTSAYSINVGCATITLSSDPLPSAAVLSNYSQTLTASGGVTPYTFTLIDTNSLPDGLTLSTNGIISGTPTEAGHFEFSVLATDANTCQSSNTLYELDVACPVITFDQATLANATAAVNYSQTLSASGGIAPYSFQVTSGTLPDGLSLQNGIISGTPTKTGNFNFTIVATDANSCPAGSNYVINVACPTILLSPSSLSSATAALPYNQNLTANGGVAPYNFQITSGILPGGGYCYRPMELFPGRQRIPAVLILPWRPWMRMVVRRVKTMD